MLKDYLTKRSKELPVSTIGKLLKIMEINKSVISLGPGEPDFPAPPHVIDAVHEAMKNKKTHYSPPGGRDDLKEQIIKKLKKENKIKADIDNIVVTTGSTEGLLLSLLCVVDVGEGVMIPDPGFLAYKPMVEIMNGMPLSIRLEETNEFKITKELLEEALVPEKTKAIIVNSPSNPTGTVYTKKILEEIADFAVQNDLIILSDEAYEKFVYEGKHVSIGSLNGMNKRTITLHSFSKSYGMPGFRLGYAVGPKEVMQTMKKVHIFSTICAPTMSQHAGIAALKGSTKYMDQQIADYDKRRRYMYKRFNDMAGMRCVKPEGAFYAFPNIDYFEKSSLEFSEWLLKRAKVGVMPGIEFGLEGEGYIRCSYATSFDKIKTALNKMESVLSKL